MLTPSLQLFTSSRRSLVSFSSTWKHFLNSSISSSYVLSFSLTPSIRLLTLLSISSTFRLILRASLFSLCPGATTFFLLFPLDSSVTDDVRRPFFLLYSCKSFSWLFNSFIFSSRLLKNGSHQVSSRYC